MSAFTDRVTHLVAVDHGGAKYMVRGLFAIRSVYFTILAMPVCAREKNTYLKALVDNG